MSGEEDWLLRPVMRGMLRAESLVAVVPGVDLAYIALLNEALDVEAENLDRLHAHLKRNHSG